MTISLPSPSWPLVDSEGKLTPPWYTYFKSLEGDVGDLDGDKAAATQTFSWPFVIEAPKNQDYLLVVNAKFPGTIKNVTSKSAAGTCTATFKINTTALGVGAADANQVSSTEETRTHSTANAFVAGDDVVVTVSANASCDRASFNIEYERTLA